MIKLEHIEKKNNHITCNAFVENCSESILLSVDIERRELESNVLPTGYEWCVSHLAHARKALLDMLDSGKIEHSKVIMWY